MSNFLKALSAGVAAGALLLGGPAIGQDKDRRTVDSVEKNGKVERRDVRRDGDRNVRRTADADYKSAVRDADAQYKRASERCRDLKGNEKDVCVTEAKAARTKARADAKAKRDSARAEAKADRTVARNKDPDDRKEARREAAEDKRDARREAAEERREADYKVARERCDSLSGDAKDKCMQQAKQRFEKGRARTG